MTDQVQRTSLGASEEGLRPLAIHSSDYKPTRVGWSVRDCLFPQPFDDMLRMFRVKQGELKVSHDN